MEDFKKKSIEETIKYGKSLMDQIATLKKEFAHVANYLLPLGINIQNDKFEESTGNDNDLKKSSYPKSGTREEKVIYIITNKDRPMLLHEITDAIGDYEGGAKDKVMTSLFYHLQQMVKGGKIVVKKINNSNKHTFYALPSFLDDRKRLKTTYMPPKETWGNKQEDEIKTLIKESW